MGRAEGGRARRVPEKRCAPAGGSTVGVAALGCAAQEEPACWDSGERQQGPADQAPQAQQGRCGRDELTKSRRAWRGACERCEAFPRVGVKVWSMVPWLGQGPGVRLWGHAMPDWQRGLCQYPEPRVQNPHLRPVGLCWNGTGTGDGTGTGTGTMYLPCRRARVLRTVL